jgi:hypothetical protein
MAASVFRGKFMGHFASQYVKQIYEFVYNRDAAKGAGLRMICSEFVAACYETAACKLSKDKGSKVTALNADPRALTAKALEAVLNRSNQFECVGRYRGSLPQEHLDYARYTILEAVGKGLVNKDPRIAKLELRNYVEQTFGALMDEESRADVKAKLDADRKQLLVFVEQLMQVRGGGRG